MDKIRIIKKHPFDPVFDENSEILMLGSIPSESSEESGFYYGDSRNRFWDTLEKIFDKNNTEVPLKSQSKDKKIEFLLKHKIALWDVYNSCKIKNQKDSTIKEQTLNDMGKIFSAQNAPKIRKILVNSSFAYKDFTKEYGTEFKGAQIKKNPNPSPANRFWWSNEKLLKNWEENILN